MPMRLLAQAFQAVHPQHTVEVLPSLGSGGGIKATLANAIDIDEIVTLIRADLESRGLEPPPAEAMRPPAPTKNPVPAALRPLANVVITATMDGLARRFSRVFAASSRA